MYMKESCHSLSWVMSRERWMRDEEEYETWLMSHVTLWEMRKSTRHDSWVMSLSVMSHVSWEMRERWGRVRDMTHQRWSRVRDMTHESSLWEMRKTWLMSPLYEIWLMSPLYESRDSCHMSPLYDSLWPMSHVLSWDMSHDSWVLSMRVSWVIHIHESWLMSPLNESVMSLSYTWVMTHESSQCVTHTSDSCHTYESVTAHIQTS